MNSSKTGTPTPREGACPDSCPHFRIGLPILPVRYAVLGLDSQLPGLAKTFEDPDLVGLGNSARYGLRLLRRGYVYVYNENYCKLDGYMVTRKGTLWKLSPGVPEPLDQEATFNCQWPEHWGPAACLTVPNAQVATKKIWICFSDVEWTRETCEAHRDSGEGGAALRRRHMVPFDVREWLATQRHAHAAPIETIDAHVAEFAAAGMAPSAISRAFEGSVTPPLDRAGTLSSLIKAGAHRLVPGKGLVLALPDPVGVAQDLNALIKYKLAQFMAQDEREWKLSTSITIKGIREAVARGEVERGENDRRQIDWQEIAGGNLSSGMSTAPSSDAEKAFRRSTNLTADPSEAEIEAMRQASWRRYLDVYDEEARADFDRQFEGDLNDFEVSTLNPLASSLAAWLRHEQTRASFQCNFDGGDLSSAEGYIQVAWSMIYGVAGCSAVADEMLRQMQTDFTDKDAIFKRALLLNSDIAADRISAAAAGNVDMQDAKFWKQVMDLFKDVYTGELKPARLNVIRDVLAKLAFELAGALVRALGDAARVTRSQRLQIFAALGWLADKQFVLQNFKGTPKQLERFLVAQLRERSPQLGQGTARSAVRRTIHEDLTLRSGSRTSAKGKAANQYFEWFFFLDDELARALESSKNSKQTFDRVRGSILSMEQMNRLVHTQYRKYVFDPAHVRDGKVPISLSVVALILEGVSLLQLLRSNDLPGAKNLTLTGTAVGGAIAGLSASVADILSKYIERKDAQLLRLAPDSRNSSKVWGMTAAKMSTVGRWLGLAGNFAGVVMDIGKAWDAFGKGKTALGVYFIVSSAVNIVVAFMLFFAAATGGVGLLVALGLAAIGFAGQQIVELFCRSDLEEWVRKTKFGLGNSRYRSLEEQLAAMEPLIRGK